MYVKKIANIFIVLSSLVFLGCGGGSDSTYDSNPIIEDNNTSAEDNTTTNDNTSAEDDTTTQDNISVEDSNKIDINDFPDAVPHNPSFTSDHFSGSQNCALCHDGIEDSETKEDVSLVKTWQGTMMANAAIDPLYLAKVASEVKRNPNFKDLIEAKCSRCHMPMANVEAGFAGDPIAMSGDDSFLNPLNPHYDAAKDGVSCTLCHQIKDTPELGTVDGFSGEFVIDENTPKPDRIIYGPYADVKQASRMQNAVGFKPVGSSHMTDSKLCATCHNLDTPVIAADGTLTDPLKYFPEQAVYTEWEYSDFNATKSCQECHMPQTEGSVIIATGGSTQNPLPVRSPFHQHKFLGANTYMLEILKNNRKKLGAVATEARFEESISDTRELLKAAADVNITTTNFEDKTLEFSVKVTNHSGHKFPTSLPSRRAWLHVKVTNSGGQTVFESGALNSEGQIIGVDDRTDGYEPHYDKIVNSAEVQVYEPIMADTDGNMIYTFMQAAEYLKDNRILPRGLDKNTAPASARPYGEAVNDSDFVGGSDTVEYEVSGLADSDYSITVTLLYQTVSYGFMQDLYKDMDLSEVALMKALDANANNRYEIISTDTVSTTSF